MTTNPQQHECVVSTVELGDWSEAMAWVPDPELIAQMYPGNKLYAELSKHENSFNELYEKLEEELLKVHDYKSCRRKLFQLTRARTFASIFLNNGDKQHITNRDIVAWSDHYIDICNVFKFDHYVVFVIENVFGQAGSLGIWNCALCEWRFTISEELLCVTEIGYNPNEDSFTGKFEWALPIVGKSGAGSFFISSGNCFTMRHKVER